MSDIIPLGVHFALLPGRHSIFSICFVVDLVILHEFGSHGIGFALDIVAGSPK